MTKMAVLGRGSMRNKQQVMTPTAAVQCVYDLTQQLMSAYRWGAQQLKSQNLSVSPNNCGCDEQGQPTPSFKNDAKSLEKQHTACHTTQQYSVTEK